MTHKFPAIQAVLSWHSGQDSKTPNSQSLVQELLDAEQRAKKQKQRFPGENLLGTWHLCFITGQRQSRHGKATGRFLPTWISIQLSYHQDPQLATPIDLTRGNVENSVKFGALAMILTGPWRYYTHQNIAAFDFTHLHIHAWDRRIISIPIRGGQQAKDRFWHQSLKEQAFFRYFWVSTEAIAARGRGGGLALWIRQEESHQAHVNHKANKD